MMAARKSHYETLGVEQTATTEEIKRARRKRMREAHPDRGGATEEAAQINHAADVLLDPHKRLLYDATGQEQTKAIDDEVRNALLACFNDALQKNATNCLEHVKFLLAQQKTQIINQHADATRLRERMVTKRGKIKVKSGINLFHQLIDTSITQLAGQIAQLDRARSVNEMAQEMLDLYESSEEKPEMPHLNNIFATFMRPTVCEEMMKSDPQKKKRKTK